MSRADLKNKALILYKSGKKLVDIAEELDVPAGTVRRWKSIDNWDDGERESKKPNVRKKKTERSQKHIHKEETQKKNGLSEKDELFCVYYLKYRNYVKAFMKAYNASYQNACSHASEKGKKGEIKQRIDELIQQEKDSLRIDLEHLAALQYDIAMADPSDYMTVDKDGFSTLKPLEQLDGRLIKEIRMTKYGPQVILKDSHKALEWLTKYTQTAAEEQKEESYTGVAIIPPRRKDEHNMGTTDNSE